jgi:hypothetical protein
MPSVKVALVYGIAGSAILCFTLKLFKVEYRIWQAIAASVLAGLCALLLPTGVGGAVSLVAILATLRITTGEPWGDLIYPVFIARLALVPVLLAVGTW